MTEDPVETSDGYYVKLQRIQSGSMFGNDVDDLTLVVTFDTASRYVGSGLLSA